MNKSNTKNEAGYILTYLSFPTDLIVIIIIFVR